MNWLAILASAAVSFTLVVIILAWIVTHPHRSALSPLAMNTVPAEPSSDPTPPSPMPPISATPAFHRPHSLDEITRNIPLVEEEPPALPAPSSPQPRQSPRADLVKTTPSQPAGETYGTQVLFHNNQTAAADLARHEHKLLFVMHISGNFEDSCFT